MSHPAKKIKIASEDHGEAKGAPMVPALAEEHEEPAEQLEEHAEQQEADDALEEGFKEELDNAVAALEEIQEKIRGVRTPPMLHVLAFIAWHACPVKGPAPRMLKASIDLAVPDHPSQRHFL